MESIEEEEKNIFCKKTKHIMVIGDKFTGKKTFIKSLFQENDQFNKIIKFLINLNFKRVLNTDSISNLFVKKIIKKDEKDIIKFWIQNLDNNRYDDIIKGH